MIHFWSRECCCFYVFLSSTNKDFKSNVISKCYEGGGRGLVWESVWLSCLMSEMQYSNLNLFFKKKNTEGFHSKLLDVSDLWIC